MLGCPCPTIGIGQVREIMVSLSLVLGSGVVVWFGLSLTYLLCSMAFLGFPTHIWRQRCWWFQQVETAAVFIKISPCPPLVIFMAIYLTGGVSGVGCVGSSGSIGAGWRCHH